MKNTTKLKLVYALFCVLLVADFIVMLSLVYRNDHGSTRTVFIVWVVILTVAAISTMYYALKLKKQIEKEDASGKAKNTSTAKPTKRNVVAAERAVFDSDLEILSEQTAIELDVWGKRLALTVVGGGDNGTVLSAAERDALTWLIIKAPYQSDEVKNEVLKFINDTYENSSDDWERTDSFDILHDETELTTIHISTDEDSDSVTIALCGECNCDDEHGISVVFQDRKFSGVGSYMDYEYADSISDRRTGEEIERNEQYELIEKWGYADEGGVFEFFSFSGSKIDADNNPIESGKLILNAHGYRKALFTVLNGKLSNYYDDLSFIETDKELKRMLGRFHSEYDLKDISYVVKTIAITECDVPWDNYKKVKRVILRVGKDDDDVLDLVILSDEFDKLKSFLAFIDGAHSAAE
ncbi:MAG: hypothetical protein K2J01_06280 [Clostridiales bacterium]|nr:hypothetical protein [Clostridiales bacterium]